LAVAQALCSPGDRIIEVGANIGTETIGFADIVGSQGRVYAFEPLQSNLQVLRNNLVLNRRRNVTVFPFAVGNSSGIVRFALPPKHNTGLGHIVSKHAPTEHVAVECVTLDGLASQLEPARAIFMDVEGAELRVLQGARNYLKKYHPAIVLDDHRHLLRRNSQRIEDLYHEVKTLGYDAYSIGRLGIGPLELQKPGTKVWLCLNRTSLHRLTAVRRALRLCGILPCIPGLNPLTRVTAT
jgi:FkbM family methyltransferase